MPYLIAGKTAVDKENYLWKNDFTVLSEENIGIDKKGLFVRAGEPVVLIVHGGGILSIDEIRKTGVGGLIYGDIEFENLLKGVLPNKGKICRLFPCIQN